MYTVLYLGHAIYLNKNHATERLRIETKEIQIGIQIVFIVRCRGLLLLSEANRFAFCIHIHTLEQIVGG